VTRGEISESALEKKENAHFGNGKLGGRGHQQEGKGALGSSGNLQEFVMGEKKKASGRKKKPELPNRSNGLLGGVISRAWGGTRKIKKTAMAQLKKKKNTARPSGGSKSEVQKRSEGENSEGSVSTTPGGLLNDGEKVPKTGKDVGLPGKDRAAKLTQCGKTTPGISKQSECAPQKHTNLQRCKN